MPASRCRRDPLCTGPCLLVVCLLLGSATPALGAVWYESYDKAEKALRDGEWETAVSHLEQAIEQRGESCLRCRTYGMNFIDYFPYLKLGIAHFRLGNHDAALQAFLREEQLTTIRGSPAGVDALERFRDQAQQARDAAAADKRDRLAAASLTRAAELERQGRFEDALVEANKARAVDPDASAVDEIVTRLQARLLSRQQQRDRNEQYARALAEGRSFLEEGEFAAAAAKLDAALRIEPDSAEALSLRDRARSSLQARVDERASAAERRAMVAEQLGRARELRDAGDVRAAIEALGSALAADPANAEATRLYESLLTAQTREERGRLQQEQTLELILQAQRRFDESDYEGALELAVRASALDQTNAEALRLLQRVTVRLRQEALAVGEAALPPAILFLDDRRRAEGSAETSREALRYPNFKLNGAVLSDSPLNSLHYAVDGTQVELGGERHELGDGQFLTQFQVDYTLPPGTSTIRVSATDGGGKSATRDYAVLYRVPFFLATWFYAALAAMAAGVAGGELVRRLVRRRRKLSRRFNPYIAGAPVLQDGQFFGRRDLMSRVLQTIHNNSILLYGERRIGKTSFQHRLKRRLQEIKDPQYDFYPVYIDLQGTPEARFFFTLAHDVFEELGPLLDGVRPSEALRAGTVYGYRDLVQDLRAVVQALRKRGSKRIKLVLLIDEVDELNSYDPRINQRLRSLFMKSFAEELVAVVSGVGIKKHWESEGSPWYNFFEEIRVPPFQREDAVELIERPIRGVFKLEVGVTDRIIALTDCKPYLIQRLCVALVNRLHEQRRRVITLADVNLLGRPLEG